MALFFIIADVAFPIASYQAGQFADIYKKFNFLKTAQSLPKKSKSIARRADIIDSLLKVSESWSRFSEPDVLKKMYALSDSTGCVVTKVQIGGPINVGSGMEIPVFVQGAGRYTSIGSFVAGIENSDFASRVRQMTMKNEMKDDYGTLSLDFVIMESGAR
jgi:Tfp pilus assembly protein PilO